MKPVRVRIYYNSRAAAPFIWCFDHGTQESEMAITGWSLHGLVAKSGGPDMNVPAKSTEAPRVWVEVDGVERIEYRNGEAHFFGANA